MKKVLFTLLAFGVLQMAAAQEQTVTVKPKIEFEETLYNFGKVTQGDTVEHTFKFQNRVTYLGRRTL